MKSFKRNAVILTVVLFVCVAAYLNWAHNRSLEDADIVTEPPPDMMQASPVPHVPDESPAAVPEEAGLFYRGQGQVETVSDFFAETRINRRQARDAAAETLATVSAVEGASQDVIDAALERISEIAITSTREAELESMIMAKGFADCVVFLSEEGVKVTVPAPLEGLSQAAVAQITNIIITETEYRAVDLQIIEVR